MTIPGIEFNVSSSGLGRPLPGEDHFSGLVSWQADGNLPAGFGANDRIKRVASLSEAEALGFAEGGANISPEWYHIDQFFKKQPDGILYIGIFDETDVVYTVIETMQAFAEGKIRQIAVYERIAYNAVNSTSLQASAAILDGLKQPLSVLHTADFTGVVDPTTLPDLKALTNERVTVIFGEDGNGAGAALAVSEGNSVTGIGAALGFIAFGLVSDAILWRAKFNLVDLSLEFDVPALANGDLVKDTAASVIDGLDAKGYVFFVKQQGLDGTFIQDSHTSITPSSDFTKIESVRTIDKAKRQINISMAPNIGAPVFVNEDGTLTEETIAKFKNDTEKALEQMGIDLEISQFRVTINPAQDVLSTSKVTIKVEIVPVGVARFIEFNIGFALNIT